VPRNPLELWISSKDQVTAILIKLLAVAGGVLVVNIPFGFWRAGVRKFSLVWFAAVHLPILLVVGMRLLSGLGWRLETFPVFLAAYLAGQYLGGKLR
jgi:hypothetical protein